MHDHREDREVPGAAAGGTVRTVDARGRWVVGGRVVALRPPDLALAATVRDEWIAVGRRVGRADRPVAERAVAEAYRQADLAPPRHVVWLGSPLAGVLACALLTPALRERLLEARPGGRRSLPWPPEPVHGPPVDGDALAAVAAELARQIGSDPTRMSGVRARRAVRDAALREGGAAGRAGVGDAVAGWVDDAVGTVVADALSAVRRAESEVLARGIERSVPGSVLGWVRGMEADAGQGRFEAAALAVVDCLHRLSTGATRRPDRVAPLAVLAHQVGPWWPLRDIAILTERPGRRSGADGPVLVHADGVEVPDPPPAPPPGPRRTPPMVGDDGNLVVPEVGPLPPEVRDHPDLPGLRDRLVLGGLGPLIGELLPLAAPALRLVQGPEPDHVGAGRIGGLPDLAPEQEWPTATGPDGGRRPLPFVAQLDLAQLARADPTATLPATGLLSFFLDLELLVERMDDPDPSPPDGGWAVLHTARADLRPRPHPDGVPDDLVPAAVPVVARPELTLPSIDADAFSVDLGDLGDRYPVPVPDPAGDRTGVHQVLGHAHPGQGDESEGRLLLLQLDTDETMGLDWGPAGSVFFYVHPDDLRAGRFDRVGCVYQI